MFGANEFLVVQQLENLQDIKEVIIKIKNCTYNDLI